jgi:putative DNA primase/helicase
MDVSQQVTRASPELLDRTPPHSPEAEAAVLGSMLLEPAAIDAAAGMLAPGDFHISWNARLYDHLVRLHRQGARIDVALLRDSYQNNGGWTPDDAARIVELFNDHPLAANIERHCRVVQRYAARRSIILTAGELLAQAHDRHADPALVATEAADLLKGIAEPIREEGEVELLGMGGVEARPIRWLWPSRVACGKLTIVAGDPGLGKSLLSLDLAARVSAGLAWPDRSGAAERGGVVLLSAEDDPADTIRPRLDAAGADVSRINLLVGVLARDSEARRAERRQFSLRDLPALREAIGRTSDCRLVVVDPVSAFCGKTDSHNNSEVRGLLGPLADLAQETGVAIVAVSHLNKSQGPAMYRTMGSLAFVAAARAAWVVCRDKHDPARRLLLSVKNNLAPDVRGLSYGVVDQDGAACLAWSPEAVTIGVEEAMAQDEPDDQAGERADAVEWLRDVLGDGPVAAEELRRAAQREGHSWATIRRAKKQAGAESYREGFGPGATYQWHLPGEHHVGSPNPMDAHPERVSLHGAHEPTWTESPSDDREVF